MNNRRFRQFSILTIVSVYVLILVGGIVRSTGSGMGCPDWPKCFGQWIPPGNVKQLPDNYKEIYSAKRKLKNIKIASFLDRLGFHDLSNKILNDPAIYKEEAFNPLKTAIEYLNRIIGVLIGFFIFLTFLFSLAYWSSNRSIVFYSLASVILVGLEGWLGSIVVSTNLLPGTTTVHMLLALLLVFILILSIMKSYSNEASYKSKTNTKPLFYLLATCLFITIVQISIGTQVREAIDVVSSGTGVDERPYWIKNVGRIFITHRSFSWLVLSANAISCHYIIKIKQEFLNNFSILLLITLGMEGFSGIIMNYFSILCIYTTNPFIIGFFNIWYPIYTIIIFAI